MAKTLIETAFFLISAAISAVFNRALYNEQLGNWGHFINGAMITFFFLLAAFLALQKYRGAEPSSQNLVFLYALLGWLVAASWMAKYVK